MQKFVRPASVELDNEEHEYTQRKPFLGGYSPLGDPDPHRSQYVRSKRLHYMLCAMHVVLLSASLTMFTLAHCMRYRKPSDLYHTLHYSAYSPAAPIVEYKTVRYNITPVTEKTAFVGYGPEVDAAWDHITYDVGDQSLTAEEMTRLGLPLDSLQVADPRTGKQVYRVGTQVFHQLHCLNLLRQDSHRGYYSHQGGDIEVPAEDLRGHLDHCIEILRTALMCHGDIGVFPFRHYDGFEGHWPDFSTLHVCRDFERIREWALDSAVAFGNEE